MKRMGTRIQVLLALHPENANIFANELVNSKPTHAVDKKSGAAVSYVSRLALILFSIYNIFVLKCFKAF